MWSIHICMCAFVIHLKWFICIMHMSLACTIAVLLMTCISYREGHAQCMCHTAMDKRKMTTCLLATNISMPCKRKKRLFLPLITAFWWIRGHLKPWINHYFGTKIPASLNASKLSGWLMCFIFNNIMYGLNCCSPHRMHVERCILGISVLWKRVIFNNLKWEFCCEKRSFSRKKVSEKGVTLRSEKDDGYNLLIWVKGLGSEHTFCVDNMHIINSWSIIMILLLNHSPGMWSWSQRCSICSSRSPRMHLSTWVGSQWCTQPWNNSQ